MKKIIETLARNQLENTNNFNFYSRYDLEPEDCVIEVAGVGKIKFPIRKADIKQLLKISSQAKFGLREKTILDNKVRNTQEITADQLNVTFQEDKLIEMLDCMKEDMCLPENAKLKPVLHNMLIYQRGQFFKKHQDTEKLKGMVATLVVVLPSVHIGGELIVEHNKDKYRFASENLDEQNIQCLAFYADCHHEIKKVKQGHRVALTFNVVLENQDASLKNENPDLEKALADYFSQSSDNAEPRILTYLLDHEYTEHSLRFNMLKSIDNKNVFELLCAAEKLELVAHLALIELHQAWSVYDFDRKQRPQLDELIDSDQHLYCWVDRTNNKISYRKYDIPDAYICHGKELSDLEPSESEYEGYMGNWGGTMDYWYKRGAIVLWRKEDHLGMQFILSYQNQLAKLAELTDKQGNKEQVKAIIQQAGEYLYRDYTPDFRNEDVKKEENKYTNLLKISYYRNDRTMAKPLINHFELTGITKDHVAIIAQLEKRYGVNWCLECMKEWKRHTTGAYSEDSLIRNIHQLIKELSQKGCDTRFSKLILKYQLDHIIKYNKVRSSDKPECVRKTQGKRMSHLENMCKAMEYFSNDQIINNLITYVMKNPFFYPKTELTRVVCSFYPSSQEMHKPAYRILLDHLIDTIDGELKQGKRKNNDWSILQKLRCDCSDCQMVNHFLSSNEEQKTWSIIKAVRQHVIESFKGMDLPVKLDVVKKGSPHKLVMTKTSKLHRDASAHFKKLQECYNDLITCR